MFSTNALKKSLAGDRPLFGVWLETGSAVVAEIIGHLGFDFMILDLEHGQGDLQDAIAVLRAAQLTQTPCIVRVPAADPVFLKRILDSGFNSIMVPSVESVEEAEMVVAACRYPPAGRRGYAAGIVRASGYGITADYMARANDELLLILQIESANAVARAHEICAVEGVDLPFLGVNDMAGSIGLLEKLDRAEVRALVAQAERAMAGSGKPYGTVPSAGATWQDLVRAGYKLLPVTSDVSLLRDNGLQLLAELRGAAGQSPSRSGY
ncbi:2-dehydro-3-deoxyglucarate aldolase [Acidisoma cellulosilytica]|uniref:2-dehydro-3-deoxyglucarate aldolase n=1 Tax=Acidisoma cellulosilyticum TaxID=2802395 RepID=A0A963Z1Y3_9PROT|nr:aldolase/citrate lyase family protein [Acidisoma cellulosilyticum]MCB8881224.1 2-dehydro-3-deoxyglucarate aldolase [Acidisoma cellulosilyticum]